MAKQRKSGLYKWTFGLGSGHTAGQMLSDDVIACCWFLRDLWVTALVKVGLVYWCVWVLIFCLVGVFFPLKISGSESR